jgi:four helix bundle protein
LELYKIAVELSSSGWKIYEEMDWQTRKVIGDQFITALDSIGAKVAVGYGRFHYKDRLKFYYYSRGSLLESKHWTFLLLQRKLLNNDQYNILMSKLGIAHKILNTHTKSCYKNI